MCKRITIIASTTFILGIIIGAYLSSSLSKTPSETYTTVQEHQPEVSAPVSPITITNNLPEPQVTNTPDMSSRPRTLREALNQQEVPDGVTQNSSPFKDYDNMLVTTIRGEWSKRLATMSKATNNTGKVITQFTLHSDGTISDIQVIQSSMPSDITSNAEQTISSLPRFQPFTSDMRRMLGGNQRTITFTFCY